MKRLKELDLRHKAAARMRVEGRPNEYICKELKVAPRTLHLWMSDDLMKAHIRELSENVEAAFAQKLASAGLQALDEMLTVAQSPMTDSTVSAHEKMEAAAQVLDRLPATAKLRDRGDLDAPGGVNIERLLVAVGKMPDGELASVAKGLLGRAANGDQPS